MDIASRPPPEELQWFPMHGKTIADAAQHYAVHRDTIRMWCQRYDIRWPHRAYKRVPFHGERVTLAEGARRAGLPTSVVYDRYYRNVRGDALWAPVSRSHSRQPPDGYELGMKGEEWQAVLDLFEALVEHYGDRQRAKRATAQKMGVPIGAIGAAERKEWHRLG